MARKKRKKRSFFERFTRKTPRYPVFDDEEEEILEQDDYYNEIDDEIDDELFGIEEKPITHVDDTELRINLIDANDTLLAQAIVPGLSEDEIDIDLNREMLTITTKSNEKYTERNGDYLYEELSFGSFSRSILLPAEIEVEEATAEVKDGLLTVVMPKINKAMKKKLQIKRKR